MLQKVTGSNCKVQEPLYHTTFDFNYMDKNSAAYEINVGEDKYSLNVCGQLHNIPSGPCSVGATGACKSHGTDSWNIG